MKLSTAAGIAGVVALGYLAYRCFSNDDVAVETPVDAAPKEPLLLPAPGNTSHAE
jgi:uncharacterized membrane protein YebE (DUF533 family)